MEWITLTAEQFDEFSEKHPLNSIFQTSAWAKLKSNWEAHYVGVKDNDELKAAALVLIREVKLGYKFAYCPRGPLLDYEDEETRTFFFSNLKTYLKKHKVLLGKCDPHIVIEEVPFGEKERINDVKNDKFVADMHKSGAYHTGYVLKIKDSIQPRIQLNYPITEVFDERIPKKTMKKVRASYNKGVVIKEEHTAASLAEMVRYTENRHGIMLRNETYFTNIMEAFGDNAAVLAAYAEDKLISACLLVSSANTTEILYSGYMDEYKHYNSTYPLRYEAIKWASEHGKANFNFGGVEGTMDDGLTMFKSSFDPLIDVYVGEFDILPYPLLSTIVSKSFNLLKSKMNV